MKAKVKELAIRSSNIMNINKNNISFIYYHQVTDFEGDGFQKININNFRKQMEWIKLNGYTTILFKDLNESIFEENIICISFDDGYIDNYDLVFPIMKEMDLKFNIFLETESIDKKENFLTWEMIKEMDESNIVDFGLHTHTHIDARFIEEKNIYKEIIIPNQLYEKYLLRKPLDFCFPFGAYNKKTIEYFQDNTTYVNIYTSDGNKIVSKGVKRKIGRVGIENDDTIQIFQRKIEGGYDKFYYLNYLLKRIFKRSERNEYRKSH